MDSRDTHGEIGGSGELIDLQWLPIDEAISMPSTPNVTAFALEEVRRLLAETDPMDLPAAHPVPMFRWRRGRGDGVEYD